MEIMRKCSIRVIVAMTWIGFIMSRIFRLLLNCLLFNRVHSSSYYSNEDVSPPSFKVYSKDLVVFKSRETIELQCVASGYPQPSYVWKKDDALFNASEFQNIVQQSTSGSLTIVNPTPHDEGVYQCFVSNIYGTAVSDLMILRKAFLDPFPTVREPRIHQPDVGSVLTLKCRNPNSYPRGNIFWLKHENGLQRLETSGRISMDFQGQLHFSYIIPEDSLDGNRYVCEMVNSYLRSLTRGDDQIISPVNISGSFRPQVPKLIWSTPTKDVALFGQTKRMKCIFSGYPTPNVAWTRLGSEMNERMSIESSGQEIVILNVQTDDAGFYQCSATNTGSPVTIVIQLVVESSPSWTDKPLQDLTVAEEDNVRIDSNVTGTPSPNISWFINSIPIKDYPKSTKRVVGSNFIRYTNVSQTDHQVVQCNASNKHGYIFANAHLKVLAQSPNFISKSPSVVKVAVGYDVVLDCVISGAPWPVVRWFRGSQMKPFNGSRFSVQSTGSLKIRNVSFVDEGSYHCHAFNKFGRNATASRLVVRQRTKIVMAPSNTTVNMSSDVVFFCNASTDPAELDALVIKWYRNGLMLNRNRDPRFTLFNNTLVIHHSVASDSGMYTCRATNNIDFDDALARLIVRDRPLRPTNVKLDYCNASSASVSWEASLDNNSPILRYVIYYNTSYDKRDAYHKAAVTRADANQAIISLLPWTTYTFSVAAQNALGESNKSAIRQECVTPQSRPFRNPIGVCTDLRNCSQLVIVWQSLQRSEINGEGFYYLVSYQRHDTQPYPELKQVVRDWRSGEVVIETEDCLFKLYIIYVQAVNVEGFALSNVMDYKIGYSGEEKPVVKPKNLRLNHEKLTSTDAELFWDPIDDDPLILYGIFRGYQIHFWLTDEPEVSRVQDVILCQETSTLLCSALVENNVQPRRDQSPVRSTISNLWPNSRITVGVLVLNSKQAGVLSDTIEFVTQDDLDHYFTLFHTTPWYQIPTKFRPPTDHTTRIFTENDSFVEQEFIETTVYQTEFYSEEQKIDASAVSTKLPKRGVYTRATGYLRKPIKWFIGMMCVMIFLLLILAIVCIYKRKRGQQYQVYEKEKARGREAGWASNISKNKDNTEGGRRFAIGRQKRPKKQGSSRSMNSDSSSLKEYDADMATFLEDGSFIGQYGGSSGKKETEPIIPPPSSALSTFV